MGNGKGAVPQLDRWGQSMRAAGQSEGTIAHHKAVVQHLRRDVGRPVLGLATRDLEAWLASKQLKRNTLRSYRAVLMRWYAWAQAEGLCAENPAAALPPVRAERAVPHPCPEDVWRQALSDVEPRVRLMIRLGAELGLRRAEIAAVHTNHLQHTPAGWVLYVVGKGRRERALPVSDGLAATLREHPPGWLFPSSGPAGGHIGAIWCGKLVGRALGEHVPHSLRHRFATVAYRSTSDLLAVQQLLGHSKPETTMGYIALDEERLRTAASAAAA